MAKTTMKSDFYLRSSTADLRYPKCWCGAEGREGGSGWGLLCCFLNGCQEKFNGYGIWTGKSRLEVSEEAGICGSRSTSVCVLLGWLHFGHRSAPLLARKSVKRFSTYECGASGEYLPATCRPRPIDLHPSRTHTHTHTAGQFRGSAKTHILTSSNWIQYKRSVPKAHDTLTYSSIVFRVCDFF